VLDCLGGDDLRCVVRDRQVILLDFSVGFACLAVAALMAFILFRVLSKVGFEKVIE